MQLKNVSIDSMTILVPMDCFNRLPIGLDDQYCVVNSDTSEVVEESTRPIVIDDYGIRSKCSLFNLIGVNYVSFTVNSKMLRFGYLDGIGMHNFPVIENYLQITYNCLFFPQWIKSTIVFDCDFKGDFYMNSTDYTDSLQYYRKAKGAKIYYAKKVDYLNAKQVSGLQFVNRRDASIRAPFVKFYDKFDEMLNNSSVFFDKYFPSLEDRQEFYDLKRVEVTVKNKEHFRSLGFEDTTLFALLSLPISSKLDIIKSLVNRHFDEFGLTDIDLSKHDNVPKLCMPKDYLIVEMILILMKENNFSLAQALALLDTYPGLAKNTKSNIKKTIKEAYKSVTDYKNIVTKKVTLKDAFL